MKGRSLAIAGIVVSGIFIFIGILEIIGLLYFDVMDPSIALERTMFSNPFPNQDVAEVLKGTIEVSLNSNNHYDILLTGYGTANIYVDGNNVECDPIVSSNDELIKPNERFIIKWTCPDASQWETGKRISGNIGFNYEDTYTKQKKIHTGRIESMIK